MSVLMRAAGTFLLVLTGVGSGLALVAARRRELSRMHAFVRLLDYLRNGILYRGLLAEELLASARRYPEFLPLCSAERRRFSDLELPGGFTPALQSEAAEVLAALCGEPRASACAALSRLTELCAGQERDKQKLLRQNEVLYPKLGAALGVLAAIFLL